MEAFNGVFWVCRFHLRTASGLEVDEQRFLKWRSVDQLNTPKPQCALRRRNRAEMKSWFPCFQMQSHIPLLWGERSICGGTRHGIYHLTIVDVISVHKSFFHYRESFIPFSAYEISLTSEHLTPLWTTGDCRELFVLARRILSFESNVTWRCIIQPLSP